VVITQTEAQRFTSINLATQLGRMSDGVVVATLRWETDHAIGAEDREVLKEAAEWLEGLATAVADPLDLARSLPQLGTLDVTRQFGQLGTDLTVLLAAVNQVHPAPPETAEPAVQKSARLLHVVELLQGLAHGNIIDSDLFLLRQIFTKLAQVMLSSTDSMLTPRVGSTWTPISFS